MTTSNKDKLWGGRFTQATDSFVEDFTASVNFDQRMAAHDIQGSTAHAKMLHKIGILTDLELDSILTGLEKILIDINNGDFNWSVALEDVHMNIEAQLTTAIGPAGKKLHTGRSRNDQVATDIRLYLREEISHIDAELHRLKTGLLNLAEQEHDTIMPGFTHLQVAQPITFGHHLMAWFEMLKRDQERMQDCLKRINIMPLGSAALAGTSYPIDRFMTAELLGFDRPSDNSLDSVSDRDFAIEFASAASLIMIHLSRFSEELVLWASTQFDFIDIPDTFCTGSSIMPQKKNPDVPELVRGKTGRVSGNLIALLMLMKGQPLAYNKDNQEDKEPLFDSADTVVNSLRAFADMIPHVKAKRQNMYQAAKQGFSTATDLADYLVGKNIPFRDAHEIVGLAVRLGIETHRDLSELTLEELQQFSGEIDNEVFNILTLEGSVAARNHIGGTAPNTVKKAIENARKHSAAT
ncbi:MAG TPA: argininosuccinate lyase [Methylococcaceae bacterium]|jgi:argininosuccinate lyase|nr:argininosuccinate lyase [Methylococcaceae bacterium]HIA45709.1 argininosuccinate lyase [Methylococcaceae bacterium]HIB62087.1 argininosuccinate lyase [Methylococcaceae bacterium]HIN68955.1 argininosuccinate lyase [Methylococcales bacterium]HIO13239.1 argininosuccinate lyase [Methylococcales bacterium]